MSCPPIKTFKDALAGIDQAVEIEKDKENPLRYDVWSTTSKAITDMVKSLTAEGLPEKNNSVSIKDKLNRTLNRVANNPSKPTKFITDLVESENSLPMTVALYELMESVKGESDKARNDDVEINQISIDGVLPALPAARVAASIGRKLLFQAGFRFHSIKENKTTPEQIEELYFNAGMTALRLLEDKMYVTFSDKAVTIKDYINEEDINKAYPDTKGTTSGTLTVSLNTKTLGIKEDSEEALYFTQRQKADISDTELGAIADILSAVRQITQPSKYLLPDTKVTMTDEDYLRVDDTHIKLDETTDAVRKKLYEKSLKVHGSIHGLLKLLHEEVLATGLPASKIIKDIFKDRPGLLRSLFGLKNSDLFSVDKLESITGQNLSKSTAIDDLAEYYNLLMSDDAPADLHLPLKAGRNERLYYLNSVLNPHASKQSRYMLTPGVQTIATGSEDFDYLIKHISQSLDKSLTYKDILEGTNPRLEEALRIFDTFNSALSFRDKIIKLSHIPNHFPNVDYVTLLTSLQAVQDIRNPKNGKVKTEFTVAADATASGGTLTFFQALGSNPNIKKFLESVGMLVKDDGSIKADVSDIYQLMTDAVSEFMSNDIENNISTDLGIDKSEVKGLLQDTLNLLFNEGKDARELSKDPTMTFVYQQGKAGSIETIASSLADRIIDTLDNPNTRIYLSKLLKDSSYIELEPEEINNIEDLYKNIKEALTDDKGANLPGQLYDLLGTSLKSKFLEEYQNRSKRIFALVKKISGNKVIKMLPAGAVLDGKVASKDLAKYGMPIAKIFEIMHSMPSGNDVLTQKELLHKTIMDVSTIHSIDAALLYHALKDVDFKEGVVVVHDEIRGTVKTVRAMEKAYAQKAKEILNTFDIHEQMLEALKVYYPDVENNAEFQALVKEVAKNVEAKQKLAENFNDNTDALIGDGDKFKDFAEGKVDETAESNGTVKDFLSDLSKDSPLIQKFLGIFDTQVKQSEEFSYDPSSDGITVNTKTANRNAAIEATEHEIVHAATVSEIRKVLTGQGTKASTRDIKYFQKTLEALKGLRDKASEDVQDRLDYILSQPTEEQQIGEFVAVMLSEKAIAKEIYSLVDGKTLKHRITAFIEKVKTYIKQLTDEDFNKEVDAIKLYGALQRTLNRGIADRVERQQETQELLKSVNNVYGYNKKASLTDIAFLNKAVSRLLMDKAEERGKTLLGGTHSLLSNYELYSEVVDKLRGVYDSSEAFQQLLHTITGENVDKSKKAKVLAEYAKVTGQRNDFIQKNLADFDELTSELSSEEKTTLDDSITGVPLYDYFVQAKELNTPELINAEVTRLERELGKESAAVKDVNNLVDLNINDKASGNLYNLYNYSTDSEYHLQVRKLLALKSIQEIGVDKFTNNLKYSDLMVKLEDQVMANYLSLINIGGKDQLRAPGIPHSYTEGIQQRAINLKELPMYEFGEDTGWIVLERPTETSLGLVYRQIVDSTTLPGAFTDVKMSSSDISVLPERSHYDNVIKTPDGSKMILTAKQREAMGVVGAVQSLVRSTAHALSIQESAIIRDELLKEETTFTVSRDNTSDLQDIVADESKDNPWFLKSDGISYGELPASIKARYKPVGNRASNVNKFNENITWVRKDISHWLLGGSSSSPFTNPKWKWALRITKNLVAGAKIGMVVLNPGKIARDNLSNVAYLGVMGVSPAFAFNSYKEIMEQFGQYTEIRDQLLNLKVQLIARPESTKLKEKANALKAKLKKNPISSIEDKGFLNSLGSALISRESETLGGMQKDVDTAVKFLLKGKDGKNNYLAHFLMQLQKIGPHGEDFLGYLGGVVGKYGAGKELDNELTKISKRLKHIRSDQDVAAYATQFINAPQSEAVRFGASVTDLSDVLAKETYYRHLVAEGMKPEDAKIKVLDSFPNYIENMPLAVQQASDVGIIMFPSFWLRIQKIIYRMAKEKPLSLATEEALDSYLDGHIESIVDANIVNKATSWGGILHSPFEATGVGSIFPSHLF